MYEKKFDHYIFFLILVDLFGINYILKHNVQVIKT
jgi:hypothetical protein